MTKQVRWLLERSIAMLMDTKEAIEEGTWHNEDQDWKLDLDTLIKKIAHELSLEAKGKD